MRLVCAGFAVLALLGSSGITQAASFKVSAPMGQPRADARAVVLADGRVLVAGGFASCGGPASLSLSEVYDPTSDAWSPAGTLPAPPDVVVALPDGSAFAAFFGVSGATPRLDHGLIWTSAAGWAKSTAPFPSDAQMPAYGLLPDGRVFIATGGGVATKTITATQIYDPKTDSWASVAPTPEGRFAPLAVPLSDGRVALASGTIPAGVADTLLLFDPKANAWSTSPAIAGSGGSRVAIGQRHALIGGGVPGVSLDLATATGAAIPLPTGNSLVDAAWAGADRFVVITQAPPGSASPPPQLFDASAGSLAALSPLANGATSRFALIGDAKRSFIVGGCSAATGSPVATANIYVHLADGASCSTGDECASLGCMGAKCGSGCASDADCASAAYCNANKCAFANPLGQTCAEDRQCSTGHCLSQHCCADSKGCSPYLCTPSGCSSSCKTATDCATGFICQSGACVPPAAGKAQCAADRRSFTDATGVSHPCSPVLCNEATGQCGEVCTANADCDVGYACESNQQCVSLSSLTAPKSGCAVEAPGPRSLRWSAVVGAMLALRAFTAARRRRSSKARE